MSNMELPSQKENLSEKTGEKLVALSNQIEKDDPRLQRAKNFLNKNDGKIDQTVIKACEAFKKIREKARNQGQSVSLAFDIFLDGKELETFQQEPVMKELFTMYNDGDERTKTAIYMHISEMFDTAFGGKSEQILLRRMCLRPAMYETTDEDGRIAKTSEAFQKILKDRGLSTMGYDIVSDREVESFMREVIRSKSVADAIRFDLKNLPEFLEALKNVKQEVSNETLSERFHEISGNAEIATLRLLYRRLKLDEKNPALIRSVEESLYKVLEANVPLGLRGDRSGIHRQIITAILEPTLRVRGR